MALLHKMLAAALEESRSPEAMVVMAECLNKLIALEIPTKAVFTPNTEQPKPPKPSKSAGFNPRNTVNLRRPASTYFKELAAKVLVNTSYSNFARSHGMGVNTVRAAFIDDKVSAKLEAEMITAMELDLGVNNQATTSQSADALDPTDLLDLIQSKAETLGMSLRPESLAPQIGVSTDHAQQLLLALPLPADVAQHVTDWALAD